MSKFNELIQVANKAVHGDHYLVWFYVHRDSKSVTK